MNKQLVLASNSPRRKYLLESAGLNFTIVPSNYDEKMPEGIFQPSMIEDIAYNKAAETAARCNSSSVIIGADTVVVHKKHVLGKPKSKEEAFNMLSELSNDKHYVVTGVCIIDKSTSTILKYHIITYVTFNQLTNDMINNYIEKFNPLDKAGAYGIQELPIEFIKSVDGDINNVIGLPVDSVINNLQNFLV